MNTMHDEAGEDVADEFRSDRKELVCVRADVRSMRGLDPMSSNFSSGSGFSVAVCLENIELSATGDLSATTADVEAFPKLNLGILNIFVFDSSVPEVELK